MGGYGVVHVTSDSGTTWVQRKDAIWVPYYNTVVGFSSNGSNAMVSTGGNGNFLTSDSGVTWTSIPSFSHFLDDGASSSDLRKIVGVSYNNKAIYTSNDSGTTWVTQNVTDFFFKVACDATCTKIVAIASGGYIHTSNDSGTSWVQRTNTTESWFSVACDGTCTNIVASVVGGYVYTSNDSGATWTLSI